MPKHVRLAKAGKPKTQIELIGHNETFAGTHHQTARTASHQGLERLYRTGGSAQQPTLTVFAEAC